MYTVTELARHMTVAQAIPALAAHMVDQLYGPYSPNVAILPDGRSAAGVRAARVRTAERVLGEILHVLAADERQAFLDRATLASLQGQRAVAGTLWSAEVVACAGEDAAALWAERERRRQGEEGAGG